jgi:hypothetical protein
MLGLLPGTFIGISAGIAALMIFANRGKELGRHSQ